MSTPVIFDPHEVEAFRTLAERRPRIAPEVQYLAEFLRLGPQGLVDAQDLDRCVVVLGDVLIPVVANDGRERLCYHLSPYSHHVRYMRFELSKIRGDVSARLLSGAVQVLGLACLPLGFNRAAFVNNWLFTTNPSVRLSLAQLGQLTEALVRRFPDLPLVFRNVDARQPEDRRRFVDAGYRLVINRPVYEWRAERCSWSQMRKVKADIRLLRDRRFEVVYPAVLAPGDELKIAALYRKLYLEKHSRLNTWYRPEFFRALYESGMMKFGTVSAHGEMVGFQCSFEDGDRTVAALVGYDTELDTHDFPIYRAALATVFAESRARGRTLFLSTGASRFKSWRGAYEWLEHEGVYDAHLPPHRRLPWALFGTAYDRFEGHLDTSQL